MPATIPANFQAHGTTRTTFAHRATLMSDGSLQV
jgi:hypothetical protein